MPIVMGDNRKILMLNKDLRNWKCFDKSFVSTA